MSNEVKHNETKRSPGRPATFPDQETAMAAFNIPEDTIQELARFAAEKSRTRNDIVNAALVQYIAKNSEPR